MQAFRDFISTWTQAHSLLPCQLSVRYDLVGSDSYRLIVRTAPLVNECGLPRMSIPSPYHFEKELVAELIDAETHAASMELKQIIEDTFNSSFAVIEQYFAFLTTYTALLWDFGRQQQGEEYFTLISGVHPGIDLADADLLQVQQGKKVSMRFMEGLWETMSERLDAAGYLGTPAAKLSDCDFTHVPVRIAASEFLNPTTSKENEPNRMVYMGDTFDIWFEGEKVANIDSNVGGFYLALLLDRINREDHVKHLYLYHKNPRSRAWGDDGALDDSDPAAMELLFKFSDVELLRDAPLMRKLIDDMKDEREAMTGVAEREKKQDEIDRMEKIYGKLYDKFGRPRSALKQNSDVGSTVGKRYNEVLEKLDDISKAAAFREYLRKMIKPGSGGYKLEQDPDRNWTVLMR